MWTTKKIPYSAEYKNKESKEQTAAPPAILYSLKNSPQSK
jgi:hypothetical protein